MLWKWFSESPSVHFKTIWKAICVEGFSGFSPCLVPMAYYYIVFSATMRNNEKKTKINPTLVFTSISWAWLWSVSYGTLLFEKGRGTLDYSLSVSGNKAYYHDSLTLPMFSSEVHRFDPIDCILVQALVMSLWMSLIKHVLLFNYSLMIIWVHIIENQRCRTPHVEWSCQNKWA